MTDSNPDNPAKFCKFHPIMSASKNNLLNSFSQWKEAQMQNQNECSRPTIPSTGLLQVDFEGQCMTEDKNLSNGCSNCYANSQKQYSNCVL